ncbi:MAG: 4Fe-4S binding protein [Synergistaceae bacterium]|jgi:polyferredoxin|nr:4Fe-4S binding protein [Synergistaceae bacterium]
MKFSNLKLLVKHISFLVMIYGGRAGFNLGRAVPCFSCPYVSGCGGNCYLMGFQGSIGFGMTLVQATGVGLLKALGWLTLFVLSVAFLGKAWCGWLCPMGLLQDWMTSIRRELGIRETLLFPKTLRRLSYIKYGLLLCMAVIPLLVTAGALHRDFYLPFCKICPGKTLLPLFEGKTLYFNINFDNDIRFWYSAALTSITGFMLAGMLLRERFFCVFCPMLAIIHILKPLTALRLVKRPESCIGCGSCRRACPMQIEVVYRERVSSDVQADECLGCAECVKACPSDDALFLSFFRRRIFSASRARAAGLGTSKTDESSGLEVSKMRTPWRRKS